MATLRPAAPPAVAGPPPAATRRRAGWSALSPLARELTVVLVVKGILLGLLWWAFFRNPAAPHTHLDALQVGERLVVAAPASDAAHADR
jgi:hypothetical protein